MLGTERYEGYRIQHSEGTVTFLAAGGERVKENTAKTFPASEEEIREKLNGIPVPLDGSLGPIVGWGAYSVAQRLTRFKDEHPKTLVAVFRPLSSTENPKDVLEKLTYGQDVNQFFEPYTNPIGFLLAQGFSTNPAILKISPEIAGASIADISWGYILRNRQLLHQYSDIFKRNLRFLISTGDLIVTKGHTSLNPFLRLAEGLGLIPFNDDNIMVDFQKNKLTIVDYDTASLSRLSSSRLRAAILYGGRILGSSINMAVGEAFCLLNTLKDNVFFTLISHEDVQKEQGYDQFVEGFTDIVRLLETSGLNYRILGSFATAGSIQQNGGDYSLSPQRTNGTLRDVDILVLDPNEEVMANVLRQANLKQKANHYYPEISFSAPLHLASYEQEAQELQHTFTPSTFTRIAKDTQGDFYLVFKSIRQKIPPEFLKPELRSYEGTIFPTVTEGVLAGFALTRCGSFRSKDIEKISMLLTASQAQIPTEFLDFAKELRRKHRFLYKMFLIKDLVNHFSGGFLPELITNRLRSLFNKKAFPAQKNQEAIA